MDKEQLQRELSKLTMDELKGLVKKDANLNLRVRKLDKDSLVKQAKAEGLSIADYLVALHLRHLKTIDPDN
jgi:uncharacterized protein (DUF1778 family)